MERGACARRVVQADQGLRQPPYLSVRHASVMLWLRGDPLAP